MLTRAVVFVAAIGLAAFVASFVFYDHLMHISPTAPNPATHQVYELNQHGYLFYVASGQYLTFFTLLLFLRKFGAEKPAQSHLVTALGAI